MKLTIILITAAFLQVSARGTAQTITYKAKGEGLEKVFSEIKKQTGFLFFYSTEDILASRPVTVQLKNVSIEEAMKKVLSDQPLQFVIKGNTIFIKAKAKEAPGLQTEENFVSSPAVFVDVRGRLIDENGDPVEGASVKVKGTSVGTTTNANGDFTLKGISEEAVLVFSGVNIEGFEKRAGTGDMGVLSAKTRVISMQGVVVSKGYYTTPQRLNTGNVAVVKGDEIQKQPVTDPVLALEGRVAGLNVQQTSGVPGANSTITIRGRTSLLNGLNPLYIVDGVPFNSNSLTSTDVGGGAAGYPQYANPWERAQGLSPFNSLNSSDIESIEVLKDADATAIYGSRGANGVILITTKKGKAGKTTVDLNVYTGASKVTRKLDLLNTQQYLQMRHEAFANDNKRPGVNDNDINGFWDTTRYTDWQKVLIGNPAHFTNAQLNISGGNANTQFYISGGYSRQGVVYPGDYHDVKASGAVNLSHRTNDQRLQLQLINSFSNNVNNLPNADLTGQIRLVPDAPALYNADGSLNWQMKNGNNTWNNPLAYIFQNNKSTTKFFNNNLNLQYKIVNGLQFKGSFGYTYSQMDQVNTSPATIVPPPVQGPNFRSLQVAATSRESWIIEPQLSYHQKIGVGELDVLVGTTFQNNSFKSSAYGVTGFSSDELITNPAAGSSFSVAGNQQTKYRYNAFFGRIGYNWKEKYLLNVTGRRDGSSRFGPENRFGNFGAVGTGWIFSKERFLQHLDFLSFGKLRVSYGTTGNDQIPDYKFLSSYNPVQSTYLGATVLDPMQLTNPFFAWERVNKLEGGLELGFFNDRVNLSVSYYRNRSGDQLVNYTLPTITGFSSVIANLPAVVQNTGTEIMLNTTPVQTKNFTWTSTANLTLPDTKLVSFPDIETSGYGTTFVVGQSLFVAQTYHSTGVNPATGLYTFQTKNTNGRPTAPDEYVTTKPITQQFYGGWRNSFSYKGLDLDVFIQFVRQRGYDYRYSFTMAGYYTFGLGNQPTYALDRWNLSNANAPYQRFAVGQPALTWYNMLKNTSDGVVADASFARLKNIALSYRLPGTWTQKLHMQTARIYLQCQNLVTITNYKGMDPETGGLSLPPMRTVTGGVQFSF